MRAPRLVAVLAILALLAAACGGGGDSQSGAASSAITIAIGAEPTTLDPHKSSTLFDFDVKDAIFDGLRDDDFTAGPKRVLAESWESPDATPNADL